MYFGIEQLFTSVLVVCMKLSENPTIWQYHIFNRQGLFLSLFWLHRVKEFWHNRRLSRWLLLINCVCNILLKKEYVIPASLKKQS